MAYQRVLFLLALLVLPLSSHAAGVMMGKSSAGGGSRAAAIARGGLGFIYNDHNNFSNPGQFALSNATAFAAEYTRTGAMTQEVAPSLVMGTGGFGIGVAGSRQGTSLTEASQKSDAVTGALGVSLDSDKVTIGVSGTRSLEDTRTEDAALAGTFTINGERKTGFAVGAGFATTLNSQLRDVESGTVAIGYGFSPTTSFEIDGQFHDLNDVNNFTTYGVFTTSAQPLYFSGSVGYLNLLAQTELAARVGVIVGKLDFSGLIKYSTQAGVDPTIGGNLRMVF